MTKRANVDHEIRDLIAERWSPYAFSEEHVPDEDLSALFEAARWAPSSYNEQPWRYVVAVKSDAEGFENLLSCLVAGNQVWARNAAVLALGVVSYHFARNDKRNAAAEHDLGLASANLCIEATARGLYVHQMIGILPDRARELYAIPDGSSALTGLAIGHRGDAAALPENLREREGAPRARKPLSEFVYAGSWSSPAKL